MSNKISINKCEVGPFKLPGLAFEKGEIRDENLTEMKAWAIENRCGMNMTDVLWSFKTEAHRDWFILRWCDLDSLKQE